MLLSSPALRSLDRKDKTVTYINGGAAARPRHEAAETKDRSVRAAAPGGGVLAATSGKMRANLIQHAARLRPTHRRDGSAHLFQLSR